MVSSLFTEIFLLIIYNNHLVNCFPHYGPRYIATYNFPINMYILLKSSSRYTYTYVYIHHHTTSCRVLLFALILNLLDLTQKIQISLRELLWVLFFPLFPSYRWVCVPYENQYLQKADNMCIIHRHLGCKCHLSLWVTLPVIPSPLRYRVLGTNCSS